MASFYDQVVELYAVLADGDIKKAREIVSAMIGKGGDKAFLAEMLKTVALSKMALYLHDEATAKKEKPRA